MEYNNWKILEHISLMPKYVASSNSMCRIRRLISHEETCFKCSILICLKLTVLTHSLSQPLYIQAAIGSGGDGVYDTTRHGEPPKPIPNREDPQYSHIEQEKKKKKEKKKDKKKNCDNTEVCLLSTL